MLPVKHKTPEEKEEQLLTIRAHLGLWSHPEHGWRRIKEAPTGEGFSYRVEIAERGKPNTREHPVAADGVMNVVKFLQAADYKFTAPKYPELKAFFTKSGLPRTEATVLIEALEEVPENVSPRPFGLENLFGNFNK